jgi:hypothetical protein
VVNTETTLQMIRTGVASSPREAVIDRRDPVRLHRVSAHRRGVISPRCQNGRGLYHYGLQRGCWVTAKWGAPFLATVDTTRVTPSEGPGMAQNDLLDFSTVLGNMQHACLLVVWCIGLIAIAVTAARSFTTESGRAATWTPQPAGAPTGEEHNDAVNEQPHDEHPNPKGLAGLRDRIRRD